MASARPRLPFWSRSASVLACLSFAFAVAPALQSPPPAYAQQDGAAASVLTPGRIDPGLILAPPPLPGSRQALAELRELHEIQQQRTAEELSAALKDDADESIFLFSSVFGPGFTKDRLPATAELGRVISEGAGPLEDAAKAYFKRPRPYAVDPSIAGCPHSPTKPVLTSYPSGHSMMSYSYGAVLAALVPQRAADVLTRAHGYAENRLVCGLHFRSDIDASATLANVFARDLMTEPAFRKLMERVRTELQKAGL